MESAPERNEPETEPGPGGADLGQGGRL